ncbi:hypothetical protein BCF44_113140 [Kutzneria buriramensis]|uniref:Uncharacterized protein n=1 Tax=Kutzneria buriramensis TaxID=1045776 RepID=A0A3E0H783_9PSEU|nr:hypothetical protein BCF44_113140 [Kutzneria buriramensis]
MADRIRDEAHTGHARAPSEVGAQAVQSDTASDQGDPRRNDDRLKTFTVNCQRMPLSTRKAAGKPFPH